MLPVSLQDLRKYVARCDPAVPLEAGDSLYVELDEGIPVRGKNHASCIATLAKTIILTEPTAQTCQLFTGFPGSGKTTELKRLVANLVAAQDVRTTAIYVDIEQYVDRFVPISIADVLRVLAVVLDRAATDAEGGDPDAPSGYLKRFFDFLQTSVEFRDLEFETYGAKLSLELKNNPSFHALAESVLKLRFQQFADDAIAAMSEAVVRLRRATGSERIVVVADSLEKLTPLRDEDRNAVESSVEALFFQHAQFLRIPCHVIYTFPLWLRFRTAGLGGKYDGEPLILPMVKVREPDGRDHAPGIDKLREMVGRRVAVGPVFGPGGDAAIRELILASGGFPRDLLRMVREVLRRAPAFPVDMATVASVIDSLAEDYALIVRAEDLALLAEIDRTHRLPPSDAAQLAAFGRLLERWLVLAYRNGGEWFDLHPLVRKAPDVAEVLKK